MPIDDYSGDAPDAPPNNASAPAPGKFIKISVPDFMNTGSPTGMGSYLRLGAVEDLTKAGKATGNVGLVVDLHGNPLAADPNAPFNPSYDPYAPWSPTNLPADPSVTPLPPATTPNLPAPAPTAPNNPSAAAPDPTGEDLASLVQGFADDTRNRGVWTGTPGGAPKDVGTIAQGPLYGYPWVAPVTDAAAPGQMNASPASPTLPLKFTQQSKPVFFPNDYRTLESSQLHTKGGWRDHSDGNRITTTRGDKVEVIRGNYKLLVLGRQDQTAPSYAGVDLSGGQTDAGDSMADASTDFNQGSTTYSNVFEWRQCATEANAADQAVQVPADVAELTAAALAAQATADAKALIATQLAATATAAAAAAAAATKAAASTEDMTAVAKSNAAAQAAETAAAAAAEAKTHATQAASQAALAVQTAKAAAATASSAQAASVAAQEQAQVAADNAAAHPTPQNQAAATAAAAAAATAANTATTAATASAAATADATAKTAAVATTAAAAAAATAAAAAAAATAAQAATQAAATAVPGTLQAAIQAHAVATQTAAQAKAAATQAALAQAQADDARAKLIVVEAGLDATPLELLKLWEDDGADPDYRSFGTTKAGSGPRVQTKYQKGQNDPSQIQTPDGVTFATPISMGVSIAEKWSYQIYNYQGIGYYPATIPQPQPYPPPQTQTQSQGGAPIDAPARTPPPPEFPTLPEWVIYPASKVVNKTYVWRQSTELFIHQTANVTAGPRLDPAVADPSAPARTYPPDAFTTKLYDRDLLKAVRLPGARPGAYNKIDSTWDETHINDQKVWVRVNDTLADTEVLGLQHAVNNINTALSETTVGTQTTILNAGSTKSDTTVGSQTSMVTAGSSFAGTTIGDNTTLDVAGLKTALTITGLELALSIIAQHVGLNIGNKFDYQIGNTVTGHIGDETDLNDGDKSETVAGESSSTAEVTKIQ